MRIEARRLTTAEVMRSGGPSENLRHALKSSSWLFGKDFRNWFVAIAARAAADAVPIAPTCRGGAVPQSEAG